MLSGESGIPEHRKKNFMMNVFTESRSFAHAAAVVFFVAVVAASTAAVCLAEDAPETSVMLILDGSGSMWGQVEEVTKIEIASVTFVMECRRASLRPAPLRAGPRVVPPRTPGIHGEGRQTRRWRNLPTASRRPPA